jgi:hypothetical protein
MNYYIMDQLPTLLAFLNVRWQLEIPVWNSRGDQIFLLLFFNFVFIIYIYNIALYNAFHKTGISL